MWGSLKTYSQDEDYERFVEYDKDFFKKSHDEDDKIVQFMTGKHYHVVLTEKGKVICSGYEIDSMIPDQIKDKTNDDHEYQFALKPPEGYEKAVQVFTSFKLHMVIVNWKNEDGKIHSWRAEQLMSGEVWVKYDLPDDGYFT